MSVPKILRAAGRLFINLYKTFINSLYILYVLNVSLHRPPKRQMQDISLQVDYRFDMLTEN